MISGMDYNYSNLLFVLPAMMICTVFIIFLIGRKLVTPQVGLLASLILICSASFLTFSINLIPNSYSSIFLLMAILLILKRYDSNQFTLNSILLLFFIILATLTHITTIIVLIIFLVIFLFIINQILNDTPKTRNQDIILIVFSLFVMFVWWIYGVAMFSLPIKVFLSGLDLYSYQRIGDSIRESGLLQLSIIENFHGVMSNFLFFIVGVPGAVYLTRNYNKNTRGFTFSFAGLSLLALLFLITFTGREIINIRYYYLISFFFCIFAAIFIILIFQSTRKSLVKIAVIIIILSICSISITPPGANITNPVFTLVGNPQIYPFESELSMLSSLRMIESKPLASGDTIVYCEEMSGRADITNILANFKYLDFSDTRGYTIMLSDSIFKKTPGTDIRIPEKKLVLYSFASNRYSKFFDVGRSETYIYL
jgi:4-amino-4-deoxy-L-arabinose transferase-like glycosyltransferase